MGRSALIGALTALVLLAVVVSAGVYVATNGDPRTNGDPASRVLLMFSAPAEDGATVAALISVVADGRMTEVSPDTEVSVPGTDADRLGEAFIFGGGAGVNAALSSKVATDPASYVVIPEAVWVPAVRRSGGVRLTLPDDVSAFDGQRLTTLRSGEQTLSAEDVGQVLRATSYLGLQEQSALRDALTRQLASAVVDSADTPENITSDLSAEALKLWLNTQLKDALAAP